MKDHTDTYKSCPFYKNNFMENGIYVIVSKSNKKEAKYINPANEYFKIKVSSFPLKDGLYYEALEEVIDEMDLVEIQ